jgi:hypothetical protein
VRSRDRFAQSAAIFTGKAQFIGNPIFWAKGPMRA